MLAALSGTYWVLKSTDTNSVATATTGAPFGQAALDPLAVARALGGGVVATRGPEAVPAQAVYALVGVLADKQSGGAALIAIDGKAAKPYRVGSAVDGNLVLQSVATRRAVLATSMEAPASMTLDMPPLSK